MKTDPIFFFRETEGLHTESDTVGIRVGKEADVVTEDMVLQPCGGCLVQSSRCKFDPPDVLAGGIPERSDYLVRGAVRGERAKGNQFAVLIDEIQDRCQPAKITCKQVCKRSSNTDQDACIEGLFRLRVCLLYTSPSPRD